LDAASEYDRVREKAGLFDASHRSKIQVVGPDAAGFLHNLSTNDIRNLGVGAGCEAFLTNAKAKVIGYCRVYHLAANENTSSFGLDSDAGTGGNIIQHLDKFLISEQVEIVDRTGEFAQFSVLGSESRQILAKILGTEVERVEEWQCVWVPGANEIPWCQIRFDRRLGIDCFDVIFPPGESTFLGNRIIAAGALPAGSKTMEIFRIEAGIPIYGIDIDENVLAPEVGRSAISYTKGCYLGQETIVRIRDLGHVNRIFRGLKILHGNEAPRGSKVLFESKEIGEVTSSVRSPRLGGVIALAFLHRSCQEPGTRVEVAVGTDRVGAEVSSLPFGQSGNT